MRNQAGQRDEQSLKSGVASGPEVMSEVLLRGGEAYMTLVDEWQRELRRFFNVRQESDRRAQSAFAECKNLVDFVGVQQAWLTTAMKDYADEMNWLAQMPARLLQQRVDTCATCLATKPKSAQKTA